jgi:hypothetical protein
MIVGCISGESRSLSGSPFKTLESFLSRVLFYALLKNQGKRKEELALLLSLSSDFNSDKRQGPDRGAYRFYRSISD